MIKELLTQKIKLSSPEGKSIKAKFNIPDTVDEFIRKFYVCDIEKGKNKDDGEEDGTTVAYVSTKDIDRDNEVLEPEGADLKLFKKNPVVMFGHDYSQPPVGRAQWIKPDEKGIIAKTEWAPTQLGEDLKKLYNNGFMRAFSVGFIPREWVDGNKEGEPKRIYKKWELLEYSVVPIPANPHALALAQGGGIIKSKSLKEIFELKDGVNIDIQKYPNRKLIEQYFQEEIFKKLWQKQDDRPPTVVQTLIFDKGIFDTEEGAKKWARDHDCKDEKVDETEDGWRLRQRDPGDFDPDSFRTISLDKGVKAVVGHLKESIKQTEDTSKDELEKLRREVSELQRVLNELSGKVINLEKELLDIKNINQEKSVIKIKDENKLKVSAEEVPKIKAMIEEAIRSEIKRLTGKVD